MVPVGQSPAPGATREPRPRSALRTVIGVFGVLAALAGMEHGVGEILQGPVPPAGLVIRSWPDHEAFVVLDGEPALTVIPNLLASGVATVAVAAALAAWAVAGVHRRHGPFVLIGLSIVLFTVGGGFGPPLLGVILGLGALVPVVPFREPGPVARAVAGFWPWALGAGMVGYLGLVPGTLFLHALCDTPPDELVYALMVLAFGGLLLALAGARAWVRLEALHMGS